MEHNEGIDFLTTQISLQKGIPLAEIRFDVRSEWEELISTKHGYESFANFLAEQFSVENLLFITEFSQLIDVVMENEKLKSLIETESVQRHRLTLPAELPLSMLAERLQQNARNVKQIDDTRNDTENRDGMESMDGCCDCTKKNGNKEMESIYASLKALYQKYIEYDCAPLEINISSRKRGNITEAFTKELDRKSMEEIVDAMGLAADEIVSLLTEAAIRHSSVSERKKTDESSVNGQVDGDE